MPSSAQAASAVAGFFGKCQGVTIKDLTIANSTFTGKKNGEEGNIGAIAGEFDDYVDISSLKRIEGIMQNCHVAADVTVTVYDNTFDYDSELFLGGLIGRVFLSNANSRIEMCSNSAHVYCGNGAGGIVGKIETSSDYYTFTISNCCNFGTLEYGGDATTRVYRVGGIVGMSNSTLIQNCFNSGYIKATNKSASVKSGHQTMGGIAGYLEKSNILNCYNTGTIEYFNCSYTSSKIGYGCGIAMDSGEDGKNITTSIKYCHNYGVVKFYVYNNSTRTLEGIYENGVPAYENKVSSSLSRNYYLKENTKLVLDSDDPDNPQNERIYWLETAEAYRTQESYVDWDFENVWIMGDNYPVLRALSYNIVFHPNYTGASNVTKKVEYKGKVASLLPSRAGYTLVGWYTNSALTNAFNFNTPITANMELYAKWQETEYSIHYAMNDGVNSNNNPDSYKMSTLPITLENPFRGTYEFLGWTMNGVDTPTKDLTIPAGTTGDLTITANWTKIYTITYALNGGENDGNNPTNYTELTPTIILADPSKVGYVFSGWTTTGITTPTKGLTIEQGSSGNKTFIANWSAINYTITYLKAENGTNGVTNTNPTSYTIETAMFTLTDPSRTGYSFDGWTENDTTITQGSTGNKTFTANWDINIYLITYTNAENGENGVTNTNPKTYTVEDENFTLVAPSRTGYQFLGWDENDVTIEQGSTGDKTFTANWTQTYAITYLNATVGLDRVTSNNNPDVYTVLEDVVLNDPVRTGYTFNGWTENSEPITKITAGSTGDKTLTANWTMDIYQITYANLFDSTNPNAGTTSYTVESAEIVLADPSRTGYTFEGWTEGNMIAAGSTGNKTFTANWTLVKPTLSMDGYSHVYDGISHSITVTPTHALAVEYSYQWKKGDDIIVGATTATISVKDVLDSATYTVTVTASINGDHSLQEKSVVVDITPKALFITANDTTITYGDAPANDGVTYNGFENNETESVLGGTLGFTYNYTQFGNVGSYTITPSGLTSNNYAITFNNGTLTVEPKPITVTIDSKTSTYGEAPVLLTATTEPGAIVNNDSNVYSLATVVTSASPVNTYDITGTELNHNYAITFENGTNAYTVTVRSITIGWTHIDDLVYNKSAQKPTAIAGNLVNDDEVTMTVAGEKTNAGTGYIATADFGTAQTNYVLPAVVTTTFTIAEKPITVTIVGKTSVYGEAQVALTATTEQGAIEDGDADPFTLTCAVTAASDVGFYDIIGTDTSTNYDVSFVGESDAYEVTVRTITIAWTQTDDFVYNKMAQKPVATAGNLVNNDDVALTVAGEQTNAGTGYAATASFAVAQTNYVLPAVVTTTFTIAEKPITVTIVGKTSVYGEAQVALTATTEQGAIEDGDADPYALNCEVDETSDVGHYDIIGTDTSTNYVVTFANWQNAYSVTQKALTVTANAHAITYGDAPENDGVVYDGFVNGQDESVLTGTLDYEYTYAQYGHVSDDTHAYSITPKGYYISNGNYALTFVPATLTVDPKNITITIENKESVYGESQVALTATDNGIVNNDQNVYSLYCEVTAESDVGMYVVTGTDTSDNYIVSFANEAKAYSVTPRTIMIVWTHTDDLVYNKTAQKPVATAGNLVNNDDVALTVAGEQTNAGTSYVATASFAVAQTNYVLPAVVTTTFTIAEKPITVTIVGKTSVYGEAQVALTATTEQGAIEDGDTDPYTLECEVTSASNVGVYDIMGTDTSTNYAVTFANEEGSYEVTKKTLTVTVDDKSIKYAEDVPEFTLVVTGVVDGNDDPAEIKSTILDNSMMTSTAVDGNTPGKYAISFAFAESENKDTVLENYTIEYTNGILTIAKRLENGGIRAEGLDPDKDYDIKRDDEDGDNDNEKDVGIKITIKNDPDDDDDDEDYTGEAELIIDVPEPIDPEHFDLYKEDENGETPIDPDDYDVEDGQIIIETKLPVKFVLKNRKGQIYVQVNDASIHDGDDIPTYSYTVTGWEQQGGGLTAYEINAAKNAVQALATSYTVGQTGQFDIDHSFKTGYTEYTVVDGFRVRLTGGILSVLPKILRDKTVEVSLENEEDAFDLDISVEVEIKTTMEAKEEEGIDYDAVSAKFVDRRSEISAVYSVKLLRTETVNGVETITEIQPSDIKPGSDTTIIVKMEIPEHLTGRSFRILHIHSANDIEYVNKSQIEIIDGFVCVKVNKLSEFAFVNLKDTEEMDHHGFCLGWLVVIFDILVAVYFAVYMLLKRKKLFNIIGLGVSGVVLVFALIVLILHICIVSIIGFIFAVLLFAAFLTFFFVDKKGDASKQKCDKTQKIESKKENVQENVATTTTTQTAIETDNEAAAVVPVAVIEESEDEEEEDGGVVVDASGNIFNIRYKKSFLAKLIQSPDVTKQYYTALKNEVLAYNKTKSRVSWAYDSVNAGRTQILKFSVRGKTLCVYFALNADDYIDSKYKVEKAEAAKYESVPCMYRIKNDRRAKYAIDLIVTVCAKYGLSKGEVPNEDYYLPYETTEALIGKGLIKELKTVATDEQVKRAKAAGKIKYVSHVSVSEANEMISDEVAATLIEEKRVGGAVGKKDIVNVDVLSKNYNDGDTVTIDNLKTKKLVPQSAKQVKLLARGTLDKKLHVELQDYSIEAVKMVIATGGTVKKV